MDHEADFPAFREQTPFMRRVSLVRTFYPHWIGCAGPHQFTRYIDPNGFRFMEKAVPIGDERFKFPIIKRYIKKKIKSMGVSAYRLNDFHAEVSLLRDVLLKRCDILHFLDGEHAVMFLPGWLEKFWVFRPIPRIIAMFHQPPSILQTLLNPGIIKKIDLVHVVSPTQVPYFEQFIPPERVKVTPLGIDTDYFRPADRREAKREGTFSCMAAGVWLRDYDALIRTARVLQEEYGQRFHFHFHVVAPGLDVPPGVTNITVHSGISDVEMMDLYRSSDALFMPLQDSTANNVILEGIACGLPAVTTDLASTRYYLTDKETIFVRDNNPVDFANSLIKLYNDPLLCSAMSSHARQRALELSWNIVAKKYEQLYSIG